MERSFLQRELSSVEEENKLLLNRAHESSKKKYSTIEMSEESEITTNEILPLEYTPIKMVWSDGNQAVVNSPHINEFNFSENGQNTNLDSTNILHGVINFEITCHQKKISQRCS